MPALFAGHGSPMNALPDSSYAAEWRAIGERLPRPRTILVISAHRETKAARAAGDHEAVIDYRRLADAA